LVVSRAGVEITGKEFVDPHGTRAELCRPDKGVAYPGYIFFYRNGGQVFLCINLPLQLRGHEAASSMLEYRDMSDSLQTRLRESLARGPGAGLLPPPHRRSILFFCAATFFFWTSLYLYAPILPVYAQSLGASLTLVGVVIASYALPQMLLRIPLGVWFDTLGRRKPLVAVGIVMALAGALGLGLSPNTWFLCLSRATAGIGAATWVIFTVYFTSYYPRESTGRAIGVINFVCGMAHVVSTSCGGVIAEVWGFGHAFFGAALLAVVSLLALSFAREPVTRPDETASRHNFIRVATQPVLLTVSFLGILSHFAGFAGTFGFIPVYGAKIGASSADLGIITMLAVGSAAVAALAAAHIAERWGNTFAIVLGAALVGMAMVAVPFVRSLSLLGAVQVVNGLGGGVLRTTLMTLSIKSVAPQQRATAMGVYQAMYAVGMLSGPLVSGVLADSLGLSSIFYLFASLSVVIIGIACLPILPRH